MVIAAKLDFFLHADFLTKAGGKTGSRASARALGLHCLIKACLIDFHVQLASDVRREIYWKAIGVVEFESHIAG